MSQDIDSPKPLTQSSTKAFENALLKIEHEHYSKQSTVHDAKPKAIHGVA